MIYIDLNNFSPNDEWLLGAWLRNAQLNSLENLSDKYALIDENRAFWSLLKPQLPYNDKCWYSEAKDSVSVYEIEHFRPVKVVSRLKSIKKKIKTFSEAQRVDWTSVNKYKGGGYWWLSFNHKNYRLCGKRINITKSTRFPLTLGSFIAYSELDDYEVEDVMLLDPLKESDPDLLTFDPDGKARPTKVDTNTPEYLRAFVSIEVYGLNSIDALVKHRQAKWAFCYTSIRRANEKFTHVEEASKEASLVNYYRYFDEFMDFLDKDIRPAIDPSSEFSSVARACLLSFSTYSWVKHFFANEI